jgi:DNA repair protein RadC
VGKLHSIKELFELPIFKELANFEHERSVVLYVVGEDLITLTEYITDGDKEFVDIPALEDIKSCCNRLSTDKILIVHNHPYIEGRADPRPSRLDISVTKWYYKWLKRNEISLLDHIILSPIGYFSFKEQGKVIQNSKGTIEGGIDAWIKRHYSRLETKFLRLINNPPELSINLRRDK